MKLSPTRFIILCVPIKFLLLCNCLLQFVGCICRDPKRIPVEQMIRKKLKAVMMEMDLDSCTCRQIRQALESQVLII